MRTFQRARLRYRSAVSIESDVKMPPALVNSLLFRVQGLEDRWLRFRPFGASLQIMIRKGQHA
jgi:hypothetical protein